MMFVCQACCQKLLQWLFCRCPQATSSMSSSPYCWKDCPQFDSKRDSGWSKLLLFIDNRNWKTIYFLLCSRYLKVITFQPSLPHAGQVKFLWTLFGGQALQFTDLFLLLMSSHVFTFSCRKIRHLNTEEAFLALSKRMVFYFSGSVFASPAECILFSGTEWVLSTSASGIQ